MLQVQANSLFFLFLRIALVWPSFVVLSNTVLLIFITKVQLVFLNLPLLLLEFRLDREGLKEWVKWLGWRFSNSDRYIA